MCLRKNNLKYVSCKDSKAVARDLKDIYQAKTLEGAEAAIVRLRNNGRRNIGSVRITDTALRKRNSDFQLSSGNQKGDLYDKRNRVTNSTIKKRIKEGKHYEEI